MSVLSRNGTLDAFLKRMHPSARVISLDDDPPLQDKSGEMSDDSDFQILQVCSACLARLHLPDTSQSLACLSHDPCPLLICPVLSLR